MITSIIILVDLTIMTLVILEAKSSVDDALRKDIKQRIVQTNIKSFTIRDVKDSDGQNPFGDKITFKPTILINGRPRGESYHYRIVDFNFNDSTSVSVWVQIISKDFSDKKFSYSKDLNKIVEN